VIAYIDDLVESDEGFAINLTLVSPMGTSFSLGKAETVILLTDSESMTS
jgi:hypothetical protein